MKRFEHINASTVNEAVAILEKNRGGARVIAGGTDLLGCLRDGIWPDIPKVIINLKGITDLGFIREEDDGVYIGALTTLTDIAESDLITDKFGALAEAARRTASPLLRNLGTLAGNICQENRCWYYRYPGNLGGRIDCVRKGGKKCLAVSGDNRYHSIFGAINKCIAVNPSDTAPALVSHAAEVRTTKRTVAIEEFFTAKKGMQSTVLDDDEIVIEIFLPRPQTGTSVAFKKIALRKTIDFAIVNCAACVTREGNTVSAARICLNGVYNNPYRSVEAEQIVIGRPLDEAVAEEAGEMAVANAKPLLMNRYKVQMAKTLVADTLMMCQ